MQVKIINLILCRRCGGCHNNGAAPFRSVDLVVLVFRRGGAVFCAAVMLLAGRAVARRFSLIQLLQSLVYWCGGAFDLIHTHQLNFMLLI